MIRSSRCGAVALAALISTPAFAAEPGEGTISAQQPTATWSGGPFDLSNPAACPAGLDAPGCDRFRLTIEPPAEGHTVVVTTEPSNSGDDYDLFVYAPDGSEAGSSATGSGAERVKLVEPAGGTYEVIVQAWEVNEEATYQGRAVLGELLNVSADWKVIRHGLCCEANLASAGDTTYVLAPVLNAGNDIHRSEDGGKSWTKIYPPVDLSVPFGIEGDLLAYKNDIVYFGTELSHGVVARSSDRGDNWTVVQVPVTWVANDQAWAYLGPFDDLCPAQSAPYVLAGWYRIGTVVVFSCDGGLTWPIQTPLVGVNGQGPEHVVCQATARPPMDAGDTRVANLDFARKKSGRHGGWGPNRMFYWTETAGDSLYICKTDDFGASWDGVVHPLAAGAPSGVPVTNLAFDDNGTLYVLHANKLYVSFDNGESTRFVHTLPRWGNDAVGDGGSSQFFVVDDGNIHLGLRADGPGASGEIWYLHGEAVDTAQPNWREELVDIVEPNADGTPVRLDFMQITVDGNGIPTVGYTTADGGTTTASRLAPLVDAGPFLGATDVTDSVALQVHNPRFTESATSFELRIKNDSEASIGGPIAAQVVALDSATGAVSADNADNGKPGVGALWRYDELGGDGELSSGEVSEARDLSFSNPNGEAFHVTFRVLSAADGNAETSEAATAEGGLLIQLAVDPLLRSVTVKLIDGL